MLFRSTNDVQIIAIEMGTWMRLVYFEPVAGVLLTHVVELFTQCQDPVVEFLGVHPEQTCTERQGELLKLAMLLRGILGGAYEYDRHNREQHDRSSLLQRLGSLFDGLTSFHYTRLLLPTVPCQPSHLSSIYVSG